MIHFVVAYDAEARPLIDHYRLKRLHDQQAFPCYLGEKAALIVSGQGKLNAAAATAHLHGITGFDRHHPWINFGIAGHPDAAIGEALLAHQVIDHSFSLRLFPQIVVRNPWSSDTLYCVDQPDTEYTNSGLVDMEASGFFITANRYATAELVHAVKVVSDNRTCPATDSPPDKNTVVKLLAPHVETLADFCSALDPLSAQLQPDSRIGKAVDYYCEQAHFTLSQQESLKHLLQQWIALDHDVTTESLCELGGSKSKEILEQLGKQLTMLGGVER